MLKIDSITPDDEQKLFAFLKGFASVGNIEAHVESVEDLCSFFVKVVCDEKNNFQHLQIEGIEAIYSMLITVNHSFQNIEKIIRESPSKSAEKLIRLKKAFKTQTNASEPLPVKNVANRVYKLSDFKVKVSPEQLKGVSVLWKIVIEAKDEDVTMKAIEFLNMLYTQLSEELEDRIVEISLHFVQTAFEKLSIFYERIKKDNENRSREIIQLIKLIEEMLDESERKGNGGLIPLLALIKGHPLKIKVLNFAVDTALNPQIPAEFEIQTHSNLTLWQLKVMIGNILKLQPEVLTLSKSEFEIRDKNNGRTLEEYRFIQNDVIKVTKKKEEINTKTELLTDGNKLSEKAKKAVEEIFNKYSTEGKMNKLNATIFFEKCSGQNNSSLVSAKVDNLFTGYDPADKGYIIKENFIKYFERTATIHPQGVWEILTNLGYDTDLDPMNTKKISPTIISVLPQQLPRYILSNNPKYFQFLFNLLSKLNS